MHVLYNYRFLNMYLLQLNHPVISYYILININKCLSPFHSFSNALKFMCSARYDHCYTCTITTGLLSYAAQFHRYHISIQRKHNSLKSEFHSPYHVCHKTNYLFFSLNTINVSEPERLLQETNGSYMFANNVGDVFLITPDLCPA